MFAKMPRLLLMACIICPSLARALGLGEIHLNSALNEPLRADIDLVAASPDELTALRASLASREAFTRYGIDRPNFISSFTFKVAKSADGHDVLQVRSTDAIPEPFVTFLVEVNWARGRLMREYTVLLDPPTYTPGETPGTAAPVTGATSTPGSTAAQPPQSPSQPAPSMPAAAQGSPASPRRAAMTPPASAPDASVRQGPASGAASYRTVSGDTLTKIAQRTRGGGPAQVDQTMLAIYRANPEAFEGNINLLRRGTVLRIPGADEIAALNQKEAMDEVARQMSAWRSGASASAGGRLRLVTPKPTGEGTGSGAPGTSAGGGNDVAALKNRVKDLEAQLAESHRLVDVSNAQLADLQHKLASATAAAAAAGATAAKPVAATPPTPPAPPPPAAPAPAATPAATAPAPTEAQNATPPAPSAAQPSAEAPSAAVAPAVPAPAAAPSGSWLDWIVDNWQVPGAVIVLLLGALGFTAYKRRQRSADGDELSALAGGTSAHRSEPSPRDYAGSYKVTESFGPGDTAEIKALEPVPAPARPASEPVAARPTDETMSAESPVTIDQGDPIAEADFHMAYGLYDQAADLVRIALEREPERRDLQMKLLEIYFVWGNAENFLHTARELSATRDRAPAGEWDKIMIMGKQICPDEDLFKQGSAGMHGADTSVDLNLDGGENRVDIDLFSENSVEHGRTEASGATSDDSLAATGESPQLHSQGLDFVLDAPERGAEPRHASSSRDEPTIESPTVESPTVENEQMTFGEAPSPTRPEDHTAEVEIHDLGFDLDHLEATDTPVAVGANLDKADKSAANAPTVVSGLDESARQRLAAEADSSAKDSDLTQLERELEASFIAELAASSDDIKESIVQESAPTVNMAADLDSARTGKFKRIDSTSDTAETEVLGTDSTAKMEAIDANNVDLDFSQLTHDMGSGGDGHEAAGGGEATGVREAFDNSQRVRAVDLDLSESATRTSAIPNAMDTMEARQLIVKSSDTEIPGGEFAPVTMSEVGTKLDLARAYMDMGDPEGARSILEEVVQEGSASQKKEATRLIQSLPG